MQHKTNSLKFMRVSIILIAKSNICHSFVLLKQKKKALRVLLLNRSQLFWTIHSLFPSWGLIQTSKIKKIQIRIKVWRCKRMMKNCEAEYLSSSKRTFNSKKRSEFINLTRKRFKKFWKFKKRNLNNLKSRI